MIAKQILHYKILEKFGEGGMGVVYKAEDTKLHRVVALKFLSSHLTSNEEAKERLIREARAAAALNHPNICTIHDICEWEDQVFIVMEYIDGTELTKLINTPLNPPLVRGEEWGDVIDYAIQIANGLQAAHDKGIIHRDIKSSNIMITKDGQVKIMDFGLARSMDQTRITQDGSIHGTTAYMSFEQANGDEVDERSDIWSLGVVLYEMLTGKLPFKGETDQVILYSILNKEPEPVTILNKDLPKWLSQIIEKMLFKDEEKRYQKISDILDDFNNARVKETFKPKIKWIVTVAILITITLISLSGWYLFSNKHNQTESIAILPLQNLSGDPEQKYFVEGMQDALITHLSRISALRVISKTSTLRYQTAQKSIPEIANELHVDAIVEGSILREGDQVRITAQLIQGSEDNHLWAKSYDRKVNEILPLISEIARTIAEEINITIDHDEMERLTGTKSFDLKLHELVYQGRYYIDRIQPKKGLEYYQKAIELDAKFAPAYGGMSMAYTILGFFGQMPASEAIPKAREAAQTAIAIDDKCAEAYTSLGFIQLYYDWDWEVARKNLLIALDYKPNDIIVRHSYADYLMVMGDLEGSLNQVKIGRLYDPLSDFSGMAHDFHRILVRKYDEVIEDNRNALKSNPDLISVLGYYRDALWLNGNYEEAFYAYKKSFGKDKAILEILEQGYAESGYKGAMFDLAEYLAKRNPPYNDLITIAQLYAIADKPDMALEFIKKAYDEHDPKILHVYAMPEFDALHSNPEFLDIFRKIGFPNIP